MRLFLVPFLQALHTTSAVGSRSEYQPNTRHMEAIYMEDLLQQQDAWFDPVQYITDKLTRFSSSSSSSSSSDNRFDQRELNNVYSSEYVESGSKYNKNIYADPYMEYDMWDQAFRMLGGYIDCDPNEMVQQDSHDNNNHGEEQHEDGGGEGEGEYRRAQSGDDKGNGCTRWVIWAAYVRSSSGSQEDGGNKNVNGNANRNRRFMKSGDNNNQNADDFDCHKRDTTWKLLGVYRQDYYQFLEQLTKHVWSYDSYEYNLMLATLQYTSTYCSEAGYYDGYLLYVDVMPVRGGDLQMGLYVDDQCIVAFINTNVNYDSLNGGDGGQGRKLSGNGDYDGLMEYTLSEFNYLFDNFRQCRSCVDYPTYQDGYLIGNYGTDDDSLINQCWKFHSHDSFVCEADCLALATAQGTILNIKYGDVIFGSVASFDESRGNVRSKGRNRKASIFVGTSIALFVFSFISFAAARGNQVRMKKKIKQYRESLLDDDDNGLS